jgi:hypothetical protein
VELAASLVQTQVGMAERLETGAEARFCLAHAIGDRADAPTLQRVQVKDAIGLCETDGAEDDGFGLPGARHEASLSQGPGMPPTGRGGTCPARSPPRWNPFAAATL